jgi:hypothetical protein
MNSDSRLISAYSWLASDDLREMIPERARIPLDSLLDRARGLMLMGLNRDVGNALKLAGTVDDMVVRGLYVTRSALVARVEASGQALVAARPR